MSTFFNSVHITNFKSLKDVTLSDCRRINLLIGKPNVGKSNILEAIGLFSLPYFKYNKSKKLTQFVRFENIAELFFDGDIGDKITIRTDDQSFCNINYIEEQALVKVEIDLKGQNPYFDIMNRGGAITNESLIISVDNKFNLSVKNNKNFYPSHKIKYYKFTQNFISKKTNFFSLVPPSGINLLDVIERDKSLKKELLSLFSEYDLNLLFDKTNHTLRVVKTLRNDNEIVSFPYSSIADTLQRIIFFKAAITSNKNSILLFEEPEAHCFPPYIAHFTQEVINSTTNQFFIATHSPYVLNDFLEYERNDVAIFMADFKDGETVINRLTDNEVNEVYDYGIDVFFNYERFTTHG